MPLFPDTNAGWPAKPLTPIGSSEVQVESLPSMSKVEVRTSADAAIGATAVPVGALSSGLAAGDRVYFSDLQAVVLTAPAAAGATSLAVEALTVRIPSGSKGITDVDNTTAYNAKTRVLTFRGESTAPLAFNATDTAIQTALEGLTAITPGDVTVQGVAPTFVYSWGGAYANKPVGAIESDNTSFEVAVVGASEGAIEHIKRENTRAALRRIGLLRSPAQVNNDVEASRRRKPRDIGDPNRIPGEE